MKGYEIRGLVWAGDCLLEGAWVVGRGEGRYEVEVGMGVEVGMVEAERGKGGDRGQLVRARLRSEDWCSAVVAKVGLRVKVWNGLGMQGRMKMVVFWLRLSW